MSKAICKVRLCNNIKKKKIKSCDSISKDKDIFDHNFFKYIYSIFILIPNKDIKSQKLHPILAHYSSDSNLI